MPRGKGYRALRADLKDQRVGLALLWQIVDFVAFYRIPESIFQ